MKALDEIREKLDEVEFKLRQIRALGNGSSGQARTFEGWQAALEWVLNELHYLDHLDE